MLIRALLGFIQIHIVVFGIQFAQQESNVSDADASKDNETITLDWNVWCKYQPNEFECNREGVISRFYYDIKMDDCKTARFGGCIHNINQFSTISDCHEHCREAGPKRITDNLSVKVYCRLQHDFGDCNEYYPMWYFDVSIRACKGFSYSGCGGNFNRFPSAQICTATCGGVAND